MTDSRTTELLPCPWCGGEADISDEGLGTEPERYWAFCANGRCFVEGTPAFTTEAEAIAAWNTRADTEYGGIPATDENMAKYGWVREQTCEWLLEHSGTLYDKWRCSECGYEYVESRTDSGATELDPRFCPNCGKKVKR